ncbi:TfoX/Sxy family protein [Flexivirga meconopsidis]|uniref:TfoX/Sxy family protein n=1 Tax=Flexivirga meconopsidis TaxID=2977121 RepID=UPI00223FF595|nr:TfoX/Sxy family protein [Flexivirga meconopsidis]
MAYDEALVERIRAQVVDELDVTDKRMFGGLAFLVGGRMAVAANRKGALMARVDPEDIDALLAQEGVSPMVMRGKELAGWVVVDGARLDDDGLAQWLDRALEYARTLPPK